MFYIYDTADIKHHSTDYSEIFSKALNIAMSRVLEYNNQKNFTDFWGSRKTGDWIGISTESQRKKLGL